MSEAAQINQPDHGPINVGIVGATGLVGSVMLDILSERDFPVGDLRLFASERSAGTPIEWRDREIIVENANTADFTGLDIALFSAGSDVSRALAPKVAEAGAYVIDNSSAWRKDSDVPLVVAEVNPETLDHMPKKIIANPNCSTMPVMVTMKPLHELAGLEKMIISTYQATSGLGQAGIDERHAQAWRPYVAREVEAQAASRLFPEPIVRNAIPLRGEPDKDEPRSTDEELKLRDESRKILNIANLAVSATCVSIDVDVGHGLSVEAVFRDPISPETAEAILAETPGLRLSDLPTPRRVARGDDILVGRIRQSGAHGEYGLSTWMTIDNVRKGAALNAVQLGELLVQRGYLN